MQRVKAHAYSTMKYSTIVLSGLTLGCVGGLICFAYGAGTGLPGMAHTMGIMGGSLIGVATAAIAALPFQK
jgi:hypothetical protein